MTHLVLLFHPRLCATQSSEIWNGWGWGNKITFLPKSGGCAIVLHSSSAFHPSFAIAFSTLYHPDRQSFLLFLQRCSSCFLWSPYGFLLRITARPHGGRQNVSDMGTKHLSPTLNFVLKVSLYKFPPFDLSFFLPFDFF